MSLGHLVPRPQCLQRRGSEPYNGYIAPASYSGIKASALSLLSPRRATSLRSRADASTASSYNGSRSSPSRSASSPSHQVSARNIYRQPHSYTRANISQPSRAWEVKSPPKAWETKQSPSRWDVKQAPRDWEVRQSPNRQDVYEPARAWEMNQPPRAAEMSQSPQTWERKKPVKAWELRRQPPAGRAGWCTEGGEMAADNSWLCTPPRSRRALTRMSRSLEEQQEPRPRPRRHGILKKSLTGLEYYDELLDTENSDVDKAAAAKHAQFCNNVDVIYFKQAERTTCQASRSQEKLKEDKRLFTVVQEADSNGNAPLNNKEPHSSSENDTSDEENTRCSHRAPPRQLVSAQDIDKFTDEEGNKKLRLFVRIGGEYIRNRTSVKAMSGGRRMVVMVYKYEVGNNGGRYLHQYVERVWLPQQIDPYNVKASMDRDGNLTIESSIVCDLPESPISPDKPSR